MNTHIFNLPDFNYDKILSIARKVDPINYMDLAHDYILTGKSIRSLKFFYRTVNEIDYTIYQDTCNTCQCCNEIKPISAFRIHHRDGKTFTENVCRKCNTKKDTIRKIESKNHIMKLVKIEVGTGNSARPMLTFSQRGIFTLNAAMADLIKFKKGDHIVFLKDEEKPKNWFITLSKDEGFPVQVVKSGKYTSRKFQRKPLFEVMRKALIIPDSCNTFLIGSEIKIEGVSYYPLTLNRS